MNKLYTSVETREILLEGNLYERYLGRGRNRTAYKENKKLYNSIMHHTTDLKDAFIKQDTTRFRNYYNFGNRIRYIVYYNYNIEALRCKCGRRLNWSTYCRECAPRDFNVGRKSTPEQRLRSRLGALNYLAKTKGQVIPRYNIHSISVIEELGRELGCNFLHAENGGEYHIKELGYFLDGYDPDRNVVVEIYEKHHYDSEGNLRPRDVVREREIKSYLKCEFIQIRL